MSEIEIFDSRGQVRTTYSSEEITALSPDRKQRFEKLRSAAQESEAAELALKTATDDLHTAVRDHTAAVEALDRVKPKPTFHDLWKQTFQAGA
jgi:hypothetical protein